MMRILARRTLVTAFLLSLASFPSLMAQAGGACGTADSIRVDTVSVVVPDGRLHGTLTRPATSRVVPVVLFLVGSGPIDRDGNVAGSSARNDAFKMLAEDLARRSIASIRFDRRGIGASAAVQRLESDFVFTSLVADAKAWAKQVAHDPRFGEVVAAGHSEGSLTAILAAQTTPIDRVITINGPGRPHWQVLHDQLAGRLPAALTMKADSIVQQILLSDTAVQVPRDLSALFRPSVQPYLRSLFRFDPGVEIGRLTQDVLILQGTVDMNVNRAEAEVLRKSTRHPTVIYIENMNHLMKTASDDERSQYATYVDPTVPLAAGLVDSIARFVCVDREK